MSIMDRVTAASSVERPLYPWKARPYSSHQLLVEEFARPGEGRRVLDLGCASGYLAEALAARGYAVTGVDRPGTPHAETIEFIAADLDSGLPSLAGRFDFILCADVLEHLHDPLRLLRECRGRLAADGVLIASLPNSGNLYFRWNVLLGRFPRHDRGLFDRTHLQFYTWAGWRELLVNAGFRIQTVRVSGAPLGLALPHWDGSAAVRIGEWVSFQLARRWKTLFAYQFLVCARAEGVE